MSPKKVKLSAIVIAKNEEKRIGTCLDALGFADERIVVDNGSTDQTVDIAKKHKAFVISFRTTDFAKLRNIGAAKATCRWVLYVDADEVVTPKLTESIRKVVGSGITGGPDGFELHRVNYYLGRRWPNSEWILRLFRKDAFRHWKGELHESAIVTGIVERLDGDVVHNTHRSLEEMVIKTNEWSKTEAALREASNHPPISWWRLLRVTGTGFLNSYIHQGGWRAGMVGWIESIYQGFSMFITYAKLWELQQRSVHGS